MSTPRRTAWQLQDAKNRLSEVVDEAIRTGPQLITRRGAPAVYVVAAEEWARVAGTQPALVDTLRRAPRVPGGLDVTRSADTGRDLDL